METDKIKRFIATLPTRCRFWPRRSAAALATLVLAATLQGCASLSEGECRSANWQVLGEADGQRGLPLSQLGRYQSDCAQYGVVPDAQAYAAGRARGLAYFCTESTGYREGRAGAPDQGVCPPNLQATFRRGYELGKSVETAHHVLITTADGIRNSRDEIDDLKSNIADNKSRMSAAELGAEEKANLKRDNDSHERRIKRIEEDLIMLGASAALSIAQYSAAVRAARAAGYDEPMEAELIYEIQRLAR